MNRELCTPYLAHEDDEIWGVTLVSQHAKAKDEWPHFAYDIFNLISLDEHCFILIQISMTIIYKGPISNKPALVQKMAWRRLGDKPLCEPMMA